MLQQKLVNENEYDSQQNSQQNAQQNVPFRHMNEAYLDFQERLTFDFLISEDANDFNYLIEKFQMISGNTTAYDIDYRRCMAYVCIPSLYYPISWIITSNFEVPSNHFALVDSQSTAVRQTEIYGPGYHRLGYYKKLIGIYTFHQRYPNNMISSPIGDLKIVSVDQGTIMHLEQGGQNIILGPGIHKITEPLQFLKIVSLDNFCIDIGPEKWITVPDGYDGIAINRGQIRILQGGKQHHLSHIGDKFSKMVPKTLLTDRITTDILQYVYKQDINQLNQNSSPQTGDPSLYLQSTTSEGSIVILESMIFWKIVDTQLAAKTAMEILKTGAQSNDNFTNNKNYHLEMATKNIIHLRLTILRLAKHHLTAVVGTCSLAGKAGAPIAGSLSAQIYENPTALQNDQDQSQNQSQNQQFQQNAPIEQKTNTFEILNYIQSQQISLKEKINLDLQLVGCQLENIAIYSITPTQDIQKELDYQTKAKVDVNTAVIKATGLLNSKQIELQMETKMSMTKAQYKGDSNYVIALKQAETIVQESKGMVQAMKLKAQGEAEADLLKSKTLAEALIARSKGDVESMKLLAQGESDSIELRAVGEKQAAIERAGGQAEAILQIAQARQTESGLLKSTQFSQDLTKIRITGEVGEQIFKGQSKKQVFGKNPGDLISGMFNELDSQQQ